MKRTAIYKLSFKEYLKAVMIFIVFIIICSISFFFYIEKDIENNEAYVLEEDGVILGTCMVTIHGEPAYNRIEGKWILNCPYICVHRIAVDNEYKGKGLASTILDQAVAMYPDYHSIRMDTHHDNLSMQSFLTKYGFKYCGEITLKSGSLRRAYEKRI